MKVFLVFGPGEGGVMARVCNCALPFEQCCGAYGASPVGAGIYPTWSPTSSPHPQQGWQCPVCKMVYAPSTTSCFCATREKAAR